ASIQHRHKTLSGIAYHIALNPLGGLVGIGTSNPQYKLDVAGGARFTQPVIVAPPTADNEAATMGYVRTALSGGGGAGSVKAHSCDADAGCEMVSASFPGAEVVGSQITGLNALHTKKLYVQTIDPIYTIGDVSYATYVSDTIGLKTEVYGKATLTPDKKHLTCDLSNVRCQMSNVYVIDFKNAEKGSDLWLFWQTIDEGKDMKDIIVNLTPEFDGRAWYELRPEEKKIVLFGTMTNDNDDDKKGGSLSSSKVMVSYHLVAPRHDAKDWPQILVNPKNKGTTLKIRN
ncbi:MAG: hypothetical protein AAB634_01385, partial [Patescibacteria group bacterium]